MDYKKALLTVALVTNGLYDIVNAQKYVEYLNESDILKLSDALVKIEDNVSDFTDYSTDSLKEELISIISEHSRAEINEVIDFAESLDRDRIEKILKINLKSQLNFSKFTVASTTPKSEI